MKSGQRGQKSEKNVHQNPESEIFDFWNVIFIDFYYFLRVDVGDLLIKNRN
jgi:hypothetical protein